MASAEHPHDHRHHPAGPDTRYLSPAYLPMLVIGVYALKHAGLDGDRVRGGAPDALLARSHRPPAHIHHPPGRRRQQPRRAGRARHDPHLRLPRRGRGAVCRRPRPPRLPPPPRLRGPGADVLRARLGTRRRLPVRHHQRLGGLPLLDTRGGVHLVHPVHHLPALMRRAARRRTRRRRPPPAPGWGGRRSPPGKFQAAPQWLRRPGVASPPRIMRGRGCGERLPRRGRS